MKKIIVTCLALVLAIVASITGTLAWLTVTTTAVKNTFTTADIGLTLTETFNTDTNKDGTNDKWEAQLIPGFTYKKDPKVTVADNSVDCYLFVKFDETNTPSTYLTYTSTLTKANGWTQGEGTGEGKNGVPTNVWYRKVMASDTTKSWELLEGKHENEGCSKKPGECTCEFAHGYVTVKDTVSKDNMTAASSATLTYTAYAAQLSKDGTTNFTAAEAWGKVKPAT